MSKERGCWKDEELKNIGITYHNISEILRQLEEKEPKKFEEIKEDHDLPAEPEPESMKEIN